MMCAPVVAAAGALPSVGAALAPGEADAETFLAALDPSVQQSMSMRHPKRPRAVAQTCVQIRRTLPKPTLKCPATEVAEAQMMAYGPVGKRSRWPVLQLASFPQASMGRDVRHKVLRNQRRQQRSQSWEEVPAPPSADSGVAVQVTGGVVVGGAKVGPSKDDERGGAAGGSQRRVRTTGCLEWTAAGDSEWAGCDADGSSAAALEVWPRAARLTPAYDAEVPHIWTGGDCRSWVSSEWEDWDGKVAGPVSGPAVGSDRAGGAGWDAGGSSAAGLDVWPRATRPAPAFDVAESCSWAGGGRSRWVSSEWEDCEEMVAGPVTGPAVGSYRAGGAGWGAGGSSSTALDVWPRAARLTPAYDAEVPYFWAGGGRSSWVSSKWEDCEEMVAGPVTGSAVGPGRVGGVCALRRRRCRSAWQRWGAPQHSDPPFTRCGKRPAWV